MLNSLRFKSTALTNKRRKIQPKPVTATATHHPNHDLTSIPTAHPSLLPHKSLNLNLHPHRRKSQTRNPNLRPNRPMIGPAPLLQVPHHSSSRSLASRKVIASHAVDLTPAFAARSFQRELDHGKRLVDLGVKVWGDPIGRVGLVGGRIPTAWKFESRLALSVCCGVLGTSIVL
jgi:hypothetical protein